MAVEEVKQCQEKSFSLDSAWKSRKSNKFIQSISLLIRHSRQHEIKLGVLIHRISSPKSAIGIGLITHETSKYRTKYKFKLRFMISKFQSASWFFSRLVSQELKTYLGIRNLSLLQHLVINKIYNSATQHFTSRVCRPATRSDFNVFAAYLQHYFVSREKYPADSRVSARKQTRRGGTDWNKRKQSFICL